VTARSNVLALLLALAWASARAAEPAAASVEAAKSRFQRGAELFRAYRYAEALGEFEAARQLAPRPELDYNIARCHDLLNHFALAAEWYDRYLAEVADEPDAAAVRERVRVLRAGATAVPAPADQLGAPSRLRSTAIGLGAGALAVAAVAAALYGSAMADYGTLHDSCTSRQCTSADWGDAQARANAGYALFSVAAAAAIAEVVILVLRGREIRRRHDAAARALSASRQ
jgi:hypothetical protein